MRVYTSRAAGMASSGNGCRGYCIASTADCDSALSGSNRSAASNTIGSSDISPQLGAVCIGCDNTHRSDRLISARSRCGSYHVFQSFTPSRQPPRAIIFIVWIPTLRA